MAVRAIANKPSELDRGRLGFNGVEAMSTGRPGYHATTMLKIYLYGYLNRSQSTRRLKREAHPMRAEFGVPDPLLIADSQHPQVHVPGAGPDGYSFQGTFPQGINDLGEVSGTYADVNSVYHGFVRTASGSITTFDVPTTCNTAAPAADCAFEGTFPGAINLVGMIAGTYYGEDGLPHGFWRAASGSITTFDVPRKGYLTSPVSLNDFGQITGIAYDANFVIHGLYVIPGSQE